METSTHVGVLRQIVHRPGLDAYGFVVEEVALPGKVLVESSTSGFDTGAVISAFAGRSRCRVGRWFSSKADDVTQENVRPRKVVIVGTPADASQR